MSQKKGRSSPSDSITTVTIVKQDDGMVHYKFTGTDLRVKRMENNWLLTVCGQEFKCEAPTVRFEEGRMGCGEIEIHTPTGESDPWTVRIGPVSWVRITMSEATAKALAAQLRSHI